MGLTAGCQPARPQGKPCGEAHLPAVSEQRSASELECRSLDMAEDAFCRGQRLLCTMEAPCELELEAWREFSALALLRQPSWV